MYKEIEGLQARALVPALVATNALRYDGAEAAKNESLLSWVLAQKAAAPERVCLVAGSGRGPRGAAS